MPCVPSFHLAVFLVYLISNWQYALCTLFPFDSVFCVPYFCLAVCFVYLISIWQYVLCTLFPFGSKFCVPYFYLAVCLVYLISIRQYALCILFPFGSMPCVPYFQLAVGLVYLISIWQYALCTLFPFDSMSCVLFSFGSMPCVPYSHMLFLFAWQILAQLLCLQAEQHQILLSVEYWSTLNWSNTLCFITNVFFSCRTNLHSVFKETNEKLAKLYWQNWKDIFKDGGNFQRHMGHFR
jgi:hypothetical protein